MPVCVCACLDGLQKWAAAGPLPTAAAASPTAEAAPPTDAGRTAAAASPTKHEKTGQVWANYYKTEAGEKRFLQYKHPHKVWDWTCAKCSVPWYKVYDKRTLSGSVEIVGDDAAVNGAQVAMTTPKSSTTESRAAFELDALEPRTQHIWRTREQWILHPDTCAQYDCADCGALWTRQDIS